MANVLDNINLRNSITVGDVDGGMVIRPWQANSSFSMIGTASMSGNEYALLTDGTNTFLSGGANGYVSIRGGANDSSPSLYVNNSYAYVDNGNFGVGVTTPQHRLVVNGNIAIDGLSGGYKINDITILDTSSTYTRFYNPEGATGFYIGDSADRSNYYDNNYHYFRTANGSSTLGVWNSTGLGIGATNPTTKLWVEGSGSTLATFNSTGTNNWTIWRENGTVRGYIGVGDNGALFTGATTDSFSIRSEADLHLGGSGNNLQMTLNSSGIGIGTTTPSAPLHIYQPSTTGLKLSRLNHDSVDLSLEGANRFVISNVTDSIDLMSILYDSGNVGIGTTAPNYKLHVVNSEAADVTLSVLNSRAYGTGQGNYGASLHLGKQESGNNQPMGVITGRPNSETNSTTGFMTFSTRNTTVQERMRIDYLGNVGIGTDSPTEKLHVNGEVLFSSDGSRTTKLVSTDSSLEVQNGLSIFRGANTLGWLVNSDSNNNFGVYNWNRNGYVFVLKDGAIQNSITVTSTGIGLFDTTPSYGLDVNTAARVTGTLYSNGSLVGNSLLTGTTSSAQPLIRGFYMQSNPETGQMMAHPYLMSDLASFVRKGGTVTVTGLTSPPTNHDTLFRPDAGIWSTSASNYTGSTFTLELSNVDGVETLRYGTYCGIAFGNSGWAPASLKIEWSTDSGTTWTTALDSSAKSDFYYTKLNNGASNITNIKFTIGQPSSALRITNIFATDYDGKGSSRYHLSTDGGTVYGNVGIGAASPDAPLTVHSSTDPEIRFGYSASQDHKINWDSSKLFIHADPENANGSSALGLAVDGTTRLYINDSGNVGIGTASPSSRGLQINKANADSGLVITRTGTGAAEFQQFIDGSGNIRFNNFSSTSAIFFTADAERMRINASGNIGIGTTSPSYKLHVRSADASDDVAYIHHDNPSQTSGTVLKVRTDAGDSSGYTLLDVQNNTGSALFVRGDRNVGIGTTSPSKKLEIVSNTTYDGVQISGSSIPTLGIIDTTNNAKFVAYVRDSDATIGMESNHPLTINTNNTERIRILANGQVGIGVTSVPTGYKMQVAGSILSSGQTSKFTISNIDYFGRVGQYYGAMQLAVWNYNNSTSTQSNTGTIQLGSLGPTTYQNNVIVSNGNLTVNGNGSFTGDVVAYSSSDKRLKDNVKPIENALDKVIAIGGYEFDWNDNQDTYEGHDVGVIAQEVEEVLPEVVETRKDGYKAVKYEKMVPLLIEAIKDQSQIIDDLKKRITKLES